MGRETGKERKMEKEIARKKSCMQIVNDRFISLVLNSIHLTVLYLAILQSYTRRIVYSMYYGRQVK